MLRGLKILALMTDAFGGYGGIAQYNRDFLQALSESPAVDRVYVLPRFGKSDPLHFSDKIIQTAPQPKPINYAKHAFLTMVRDGPFDMIFCGHLHHAPIAEFLRRIFKTPIWLQIHGVDAWDRPTRIVQASLEHVKLVTAVSRYTRRRFLEWSPLRAESIRILPNTFRPIFLPGPRDEAILAKLGLTDNKIILTVSRISKADKYKGHCAVIRAMARVREREPNAVYVAVGDGDAVPCLSALAEQLGLSEAVHFIGRLSDEDLLALYRSSQVFVMPSTKEGFGIVFVEAAATGLPVIAGKIDGSVDALCDGVIGRLIDPNSTEELVVAVSDVLRNSERNPPGAVERFSFEHFANHVDDLVQTFSA
jgi:phosphatidylinositol alpha-1,6-mannosyltransferase